MLPWLTSLAIQWLYNSEYFWHAYRIHVNACEIREITLDNSCVHEKYNIILTTFAVSKTIGKVSWLVGVFVVVAALHKSLSQHLTTQVLLSLKQCLFVHPSASPHRLAKMCVLLLLALGSWCSLTQTSSASEGQLNGRIVLSQSSQETEE